MLSVISVNPLYNSAIIILAQKSACWVACALLNAELWFIDV